MRSPSFEVLVVEDEKSLCESLVAQIGLRDPAKRIRMRCVHTMAAAREALTPSGRPLDLLILGGSIETSDDSVELVEYSLACGYHGPIVANSGHDVTQELLMRAGATHDIFKPRMVTDTIIQMAYGKDVLIAGFDDACTLQIYQRMASYNPSAKIRWRYANTVPGALSIARRDAPTVVVLAVAAAWLPEMAEAAEQIVADGVLKNLLMFGGYVDGFETCPLVGQIPEKINKLLVPALAPH